MRDEAAVQDGENAERQRYACMREGMGQAAGSVWGAHVCPCCLPQQERYLPLHSRPSNRGSRPHRFPKG